MNSIAIIGPGRHGTAIAALFASHGVAVTLYHRDPAKAEAARAAITRAAPEAVVDVAPDLASAVEGQRVVALTTLWDAPQRQVIAQLGQLLVGKVLLDVSNPLDVTERGVVLRRPPEGSAGQFVASLLPAGTGHAKAFSNLATDFINASADEAPPAVLPFLADSAQTAETVRSLLTQTGWWPWLVGDISRSVDIEVGGIYNRVSGSYVRARLNPGEFTARFGPEAAPAELEGAAR